VNGQIRITEQGEIISSKYSNAEVGRSNLEILAAATSRQPASAKAQRAVGRISEDDGPVVGARFQGLSRAGLRDRGFVDYFWASTVITEIATLNIGSRPASRKKTRAIEDLRAIPWVFSWAQCRLMLPGWYGFGSAVESWIAEHPDKGMPFLQELYREWPFFRTLLSNMDMVLAKSSIAIASRYAELVPDASLREEFSGASGANGTLDRDAAGHHGQSAAAGQSAAGALDPQPLSLSRSAEPCAGGTAESTPRAEPR
jgi:phosphoenolpyruvate carboxylase